MIAEGGFLTHHDSRGRIIMIAEGGFLAHHDSPGRISNLSIFLHTVIAHTVPY